MGTVWATGGAAGGEAGGWASGVGLAIVAPGTPVPGTSGAGAAVCGEVRLLACENAWIGVMQSSIRASALRRQNTSPKPRLDHHVMVFFSVPITAFSCRRPCVKPLKRLGTFIAVGR